MSDIIIEHVENMRKAFKRAEHTLFVSLKYTRTVDMLKILIQSYITTILEGAEGLIQKLYEENKIFDIPSTPIEKIQIIEKNFSENEQIIKDMEFLLFLRKLHRSEYGKCEEFRKNVTMCAVVDGQEHGIKIETLAEYYEDVKKYMKEVEQILVKEMVEE